MNIINVDFGNITGKIKPVHGFNNCSRKTDYGEIMPAFLALKPPVVRTHDTGGTYGGSHYIDIPNIFVNPDADTELESSYDFTLTDYYLKPLYDAGIQIFYRLGVTIEHAPKKYNIFAPKDPEKWARICEHIVRHYNDGWADGYHWNIVYWEIWNEPDALDPKVEPYGLPNWIGTAEEYYRLYSVTANYLKKQHPNIKIGGYSSCYILGAYVDGRWTPGPTGFFTGFLDYISASETKAPLDFFTWHGYLGRGSLKKISAESEFVKKTLEEYGFTKTERIDDEWNCNICDIQTDDPRTQNYINMRNAKGASYVAGALYEMQHCPVDMAMYYDTQLWCSYGALFHVPSLEPTKAYYAFLQFAELYSLENECASSGTDMIHSCAATGAYDLLAVSNTDAEDAELTISVLNAHGKTVSVHLLDETHNFEKINEFPLTEEIRLTLPAYSFASFKII